MCVTLSNISMCRFLDSSKKNYVDFSSIRDLRCMISLSLKRRRRLCVPLSSNMCVCVCFKDLIFLFSRGIEEREREREIFRNCLLCRNYETVRIDMMV